MSAMARASATRFCIPPDSSAGYWSITCAARPSCVMVSAARSRACWRVMVCCWRRRKVTFSQIGSESNSAPNWKVMPNRRRIDSSWWRPAWIISSPSTLIDPPSARSSPSRHFSVTDLPHPDVPMMANDSSAATSMSMPRSTCLSPKDLVTPLITIFGVAAFDAGDFALLLMTRSPEEQRCDDIIGDQDQDRGGHHRIGGGAADAFCAAA